MVFLEDSAACLYACFLENDAIYSFIPLKRGWYSLLRRKLRKQSHHLQKIGNKAFLF
jgi:hypothetical protein